MQMTTVYFPEVTHTQLKQLARIEKRPMSELVRKFVEEGIIKTRRPQKSFMDKLGEYKLKMSKSMGARDIDRVVYGI